MSICAPKNIFSQTDSTNFLSTFLTPAESFDKKRFATVLATEAVLYTGATLALYNYWYKDYPHSKFHTFNDWGEWMQHDKVGHFYTAYFETNITTGLYNWTGMQKENAYWAGAVTGSILQLTIEVFDGFSEKWGFSIGDFAANTLGAGLSAGQNYMWDEQRIFLKFSAHFVDYSDYDAIVQKRTDDLFGTSGPEKILKDYNGSTYWLSVNPSQFMQDETRFPKWLMLSLGYGAEGMFGGYENKWCPDAGISPEFCEPSLLIDRIDIDRYRQYYLSIDVDFSQIKTNSEFLHALFGIINIVKIPAPALEINQDHGVKFKPFYF
ncbi:MAG: DUF2279 domain-containing protein [Chitinophagales bacterium]|nr:DUF2279 domain-containing protein [Chitinophagales bacterium]